MKTFFLKLLWASFRIPAQILLFRFRPSIIAITGSAGKTTTKEVIYWVLHKNSHLQKQGIRKNYGNLNTELGVPLSILGFKNYPSGLSWIIYILIGIVRAFFSFQYPKILILEMAADKIGDIRYLAKYFKPHIAIITNIGPAHLEAFKNIENIAKEKSILVKILNSSDFAVLNFDNSYTRKMGFQTSAKVTYFGISKDAAVHIDNIERNQEGIQAKVYLGGSSAPLTLRSPNKAFIYAALAAITVACDIFKLSLVEVTQNLKDFEPYKGRSLIISGKKQSIIIDDTYNANPMSMEFAFEMVDILAKKQQRKIFILGDMLELGEKRTFYHQDIGRKAGKLADYLLVIGKNSKNYLIGAKQVAKKTTILKEFSNPEESARFILDKLKKDDIILIKGSRAIEMERAVEILKE